MGKYFAVLFVIFSIVIVGCGNGATGFDKPEDLGAKLAELQNGMDDGDATVLLDLTYFANAGDRAKVKAFFEATKESMKKQMEMSKKMYPNMKLSYKDKKTEGDKGKIYLATGTEGRDISLEIVKVNGKWFLDSADGMFVDALSKDPVKYNAEVDEQLENAKDAMQWMSGMSDDEKKKMDEDFNKSMEDMQNMSEEDRAKMTEGLRKMGEAMENMTEEQKKRWKEMQEKNKK